MGDQKTKIQPMEKSELLIFYWVVLKIMLYYTQSENESANNLRKLIASILVVEDPDKVLSRRNWVSKNNRSVLSI